MNQFVYSPTRTGHFRWTDNNWYEFDHVAAHQAAKKQRDDHAADLRKRGYLVKKFTHAKQLMTMGGIGTGNPQIELIVTCYGLNVL